MPRAIIIGATSGIGQALAHQLAAKGFDLGLTGRRLDRLQDLQQRLNAKIQEMDVSRPDRARTQLTALIDALGGLDLLIINAGVSHRQGNWEQEQEMIAVNVLGFTAMAQAGLTYFLAQGQGHLVGISSISALRGRANNIAYSATKAYVSNYLQGCRQKAAHLRKAVVVTDLIPGYVETRLIKGHKGTFWVASVDKAARQMVGAMLRRKKRAYITRRWRLIAWFLTFIPDWLHQKL